MKYKLNDPKYWIPKEKKLKPEVELWKETDGYFIRKGQCRENCVCSRLTKKDLLDLVEIINKRFKK